MNHDQDLDLRVGRWLAAREVPVSGERVSERILATLVTTRQERRPILRRGPITRPPLRLLAVAAALLDRILGALEPGDGMLLTGPLGRPFSQPDDLNPDAAGAILVGGGIGG